MGSSFDSADYPITFTRIPEAYLDLSPFASRPVLLAGLPDSASMTRIVLNGSEITFSVSGGEIP